MTKATFELEDNWLVVLTSELPATIPEALEHSIQKWEFIEEVLLRQGNEPPYAYPACGATLSCALCGVISGCEPCPVKAAGHRGCRGTPYSDYFDATNHEEALAACRAEIEFLKSLREDA